LTLLAPQVKQLEPCSSQVPHYLSQTTTKAEPTGILSTLIDLTLGSGTTQFGGLTNPSAQTTQLSAAETH